MDIRILLVINSFMLSIWGLFVLFEKALVTVEGINFLQYTLLITMLYIVLSSKSYCRWTNLYLIFIFTSNLFLFSRIWLDIVGIKSFSVATFPTNVDFSLETQFYTLIYLAVSYLCIHVGFILTLKNQYKSKYPFRYRYFPVFEQIGILIWLIYVPIIICKYIDKINFILSLETYATQFATHFSFSWWQMGAESMFFVGYGFLISSRVAKNKFILYSFVFLSVGIIQAFTGIRAFFAVKLIFVIFLYYNFYSTKEIKIRYVILCAFIFILFAQWILSYRSGVALSWNFIYRFIYEQGVSLNVLAYMLEFKEFLVTHSFFYSKEGAYPYVLHPFVSTFIPNQPQSVEYVQKYQSLSPDLVYFLNENLVNKGYGIASSFIAELYELPLVLMLLILLVLGYTIGNIGYWVSQSRFVYFISVIIVQHIIYIPRINLFPRLREVIIFSLIYVIVFLVIKLLSRNKLKLQ